MKTAALELTSKKIPNTNMILQGIMKITPRGAVANEQVTVGDPTVAHNTKSLRLPLANRSHISLCYQLEI